ncbi:MAG: hypothetical protein R2707_06570 [Acidimicrobiales bacterium]
MVRDIIPFIFWPWFAVSCFILLRRRVSHGSWRAMGPKETFEPIEFPPPPGDTLPEPSTLVPRPEGVGPETDQANGPAVAVMAQIDPDRPRARSLADAVDGIAMPCDLAPLMGSGPLNPREVAFFTTGFTPTTVGAALADEFERLGYEITPLDDRSIRAARGPDSIEARLLSHELTAPEVMRELHPSAPLDALVVEMKLI